MRLVHIQDNDVRLFAHLHGADQPIHSENAGAFDRRHFQDGFSAHDRGIEESRFVDFCRKIHFLKQVEVVVAGGPVRSQTDRDALLQHQRNRRDARGQLHGAGRVVGHADAQIGKKRDVFRTHPVAVHGDGPVIQHVKVVQMLHRLPAVAFFNRIDFIPVFQKVGQVKDSGLARGRLHVDQRPG